MLEFYIFISHLSSKSYKMDQGNQGRNIDNVKQCSLGYGRILYKKNWQQWM